MSEHIEAEYHGVAKDPWPFEYVIQGLQFFAMREDALLAYLPSALPNTLFHGTLGDFFSSNPLVALINIYQDFVGPGRDWNNWIESPEDENEAVQPLFDAMHEQIFELLSRLNPALQPPQALRTEAVQPLMGEIRTQARAILAMVDWADADPMPHRTALSVLDEWSYGECSANIAQQAGEASSG